MGGESKGPAMPPVAAILHRDIYTAGKQTAAKLSLGDLSDTSVLMKLLRFFRVKRDERARGEAWVIKKPIWHHSRRGMRMNVSERGIYVYIYSYLLWYVKFSACSRTRLKCSSRCICHRGPVDLTPFAEFDAKLSSVRLNLSTCLRLQSLPPDNEICRKNLFLARSLRISSMSASVYDAKNW